MSDDEVDAYVSNFIGTFKVGLATNAGMVGRLVDAEFCKTKPPRAHKTPRAAIEKTRASQYDPRRIGDNIRPHSAP